MRRFLGILSIGVSSLAVIASDAAAEDYRLPWSPGLQVELTQDCNDSSYADHIGSGKNAWDFASGTHFAVLAARGGIVRHLKISSHSGCESAACVDLANYVVIDHGDGTSSIYLHLDGDSLEPDVQCGAPVRQGQKLAAAGSTGWSTGPHLHFQVNVTHTGETRSCECGADGQGCAENEAAWSTFWSSAKFPSVPVAFDEWSAAECSDRRLVLPVSENIDMPTDTRLVTIGRDGVGGQKSIAREQVTPFGVGGRKGPARSLSGKSRRPPPGTQPPSRKAPAKAPARP